MKGFLIIVLGLLFFVSCVEDKQSTTNEAGSQNMKQSEVKQSETNKEIEEMVKPAELTCKINF